MGVETKIDYPFSVDTWTKNSERKPFHFLTHAHKDHREGIDSYGKFPIYCTSLTKRLVCRRYPTLNPSIFKSLEVGEPRILGDADQGFTVTAYDANHCPGAIMLLFEGTFGNVLHTGDCRLTSECLHQLMDYVSGSGRVLDCVLLRLHFRKGAIGPAFKRRCNRTGQEMHLESSKRGKSIFRVQHVGSRNTVGGHCKGLLCQNIYRQRSALELLCRLGGDSSRFFDN